MQPFSGGCQPHLSAGSGVLSPSSRLRGPSLPCDAWQTGLCCRSSQTRVFPSHRATTLHRYARNLPSTPDTAHTKRLLVSLPTSLYVTCLSSVSSVCLQQMYSQLPMQQDQHMVPLHGNMAPARSAVAQQHYLGQVNVHAISQAMP